jgi:hypothetical protein
LLQTINYQNLDKEIDSIVLAYQSLKTLPLGGNEGREKVIEFENKIYSLMDNLLTIRDKKDHRAAQNIVVDKSAFKILSDIYFETSSEKFREAYPEFRQKFIAKAFSLLAEMAPNEVGIQISQSDFGLNLKNLLDPILSTRGLFIDVGTAGQSFKDPRTGLEKPIMQWAWYSKINKYLTNKESPLYIDGKPLVQFNSLIDEKKLGWIYSNGGFEIAHTIEALAKVDKDNIGISHLKTSGAYESLYKFATHPSPVNGPVSLVNSIGVALAETIKRHPDAFNQFKDRKDPDWGMTPQAFFKINSQENAPFKTYTDQKAWDKVHKNIRIISDILENKGELVLPPKPE